jgi:hypothetical protein
MSEPQFSQKEIIEPNNENNQEENKNTMLNQQNKETEKKTPIKMEEEKEEIKLGQYILTPLQSIIINKKMPFGFKLETEENILKSMETLKNQAKKSKNASKKNKNSGKNKEGLGLGLNRNGGTMPQKKRIQNYDNIPNGASEEVIKIFKKCKKGLDKMKELKYYKMYYDPRKPEEPCIADIEKKLNNYEYKSLYDFIMDVRKIWNYHFNSDKLNNEITSKMSDEWEKICADLENSNNEMSVATIKKRTDRITKDVHEFKDNVIRENLPAPIKRNNQQMNEDNKPMTVDEKNKLGNDIRSLNKDQLKGIINILSENTHTPKAKYFEFDIDKLPPKKLRELERYVKKCLLSNINKNNPPNNNQHTKSSNKLNQKENQNNKSNNKVNNTQGQNQNQALLKSNSKNENKSHEKNIEQSASKKIKQSNKKSEKKNDSFSDSDSMSSDSSLSN